MIAPLPGWGTRSTSPHANDNLLEPSQDQLLINSSLNTTTSSMSSSPVVTACFQDGDALAIENARALPASSLNGWGFHLKDPESLRLGSDDLDRLLGGDRFLTEDSDLLKFLSIPTFMQSSSSELPRLDPSILHPKPESSNSFSSVEELTSQEMTENSSEVRTGQRGPLPVSYQAPIQEKTSTELCVGDNKTLGLTGSMHVGRDPFPIVTGVWDCRTVSPKDAFLDYDHVHTKLEGEATRRASNSWITHSVGTINQRQSTTVKLAENLHHLLDEPSLTSDLASSGHLDRRLSIDTKESFSCNTSPGKRVLQSPEELPASQFSLPPHCVPKNAIRWTHYNTNSALPLNSQSQLSSVTRKPSSSHTIEKFESLDPNWTVKDAMPYRQSIGLSARPVTTCGLSDLLSCDSTSVTPDCEEFSASSEEEMITLETDASVSRFDEDNERSMRQSNQETLNTQTSINSSSSSTNTPMLQSCTHEALHQFESFPEPGSRIKSSNEESGRSKTPRWGQSDSAVDVSDVTATNKLDLESRNQARVSEKNLVEPSDVTICEPESPSEIADHDEALDVDEDESDFAIGEDSLEDSTSDINFTLEDQRSQEIKNFKNISPVSSLAYDYTARKSQTPLGPEIDLPIAREEDSVKMNRKGRRGTTYTSKKKISPYPRVTRSAIEYSSTRGVVSSPSPTAPVSASGRGSRSTSTRAAQNGCLITSRRTLSQAHKSVQDDLSGTGPIMCGHVDDKTGEKCETMFKRPYDLARHKETIHDSEGPGGDRKPQWKCGQCGGKFSRKDALIRHCRTRNH
ncbi:hypothetical protein MJO29_001234 [Puccinia striiformis f. sp. tritici]|nr:hypothetical protein MJO29_001234 [Puccinia striiformis f. sp. tritici]